MTDGGARPTVAHSLLPEMLRTRHLLLRPFSGEDGRAVYAFWSSDPGWARFNESVPDDFDDGDADDFVRTMMARDRTEAPGWALVHGERVVGVVGLSFAEDRCSAVLGFGIHAELRGRGFCGEAAACVLDAAFAAERSLDVVLARTDRRNRPSMRVLEKLGFAEEREPSGALFRLTRASWRPLDAS